MGLIKFLVYGRFKKAPKMRDAGRAEKTLIRKTMDSLLDRRDIYEEYKRMCITEEDEEKILKYKF